MQFIIVCVYVCVLLNLKQTSKFSCMSVEI